MRYTQKHIDLMSKVIRKNGVSIRTKKEHPLDSGSNCFAFNPYIMLGIKGPKWIVLVALAHEYGHYLSIKQGTKLKRGTVMLCRMGVILSKKDAELLKEEERIAWNLGFKELRANGIMVDESLQRARRILFKSETGSYPTLIPK